MPPVLESTTNAELPLVGISTLILGIGVDSSQPSSQDQMGAGHSVMDDMFTYLVTGAESGGSNFTPIADAGPYGGLLSLII